ncbi:MAG: DUF4872 domain-containing protein [Solirubrobacteraceae bacterium]|nr:DUF4872 domain-containing protein [Solirubrobacteraceae bacterium]
MSDARREALHPEIAALSHLLKPIWGDTSDAFALGVSGGAGFLGVAFRYERDDFSNLHLTGWNPFQTGLVAAAERLGLVRELHETGSRRKAVKVLATEFAEGRAVALWVDGATLGLAPASLAGMAPTVVVATPAAGSDGIEVSDGRSSGPVVVDLLALTDARSRIRSHRHRLLSLAGTIDDLPGAVRGGLASTAVGAVGGPKGNSGPEGLAAFAERIDGTGRGSWREVFPTDRHLLGALVSLRAAVVGEDGLLRRAQAAFERHAADVLDLSALGTIADEHDALADGWSALAEAALPADVPGFAVAREFTSAFELPASVAGTALPLTEDELDALLADLAARATSLAEAEDRTLEALRATLRS